MKDIDAADILSDAGDLRELVGPRMPLAATKEMPVLDKHCRRFIEMSPFLVLSTLSEAGHIDVSPRGDPPGFVQVADEKTLFIPDRPGNRRIDTMRNLLANDRIGLIFFLPGYEETVRVRGRGTIVKEPNLLAAMAVDGKPPKLAIRVAVDEVFFHCAKALKRSRLWDATAQITPGVDYPRYGKILAEQRDTGKSADELQRFVDDNYKNELY